MGCVHYFPWYSGMGWTLGIVVLCMGQLGIPTVCPLLPMVQWDGISVVIFVLVLVIIMGTRLISLCYFFVSMPWQSFTKKMV